jgi:hypothetical protein
MPGISEHRAEDEREEQSKRHAPGILRLSAADEGERVGVGHEINFSNSVHPTTKIM